MKPARFASFAASLAAFSVLALALPAAAHTLLKNPPPISPETGAKSGPCGCFFGAPEDPNDDLTPIACPDTFPITTLLAGADLKVEWQETVLHEGSFRVAFSTKTPQATTKADMDAAVLMDMPDTNAVTDAVISGTIKVPSEPCELCTIQVRQLMTGPPDSFYFTCAAVKIVTADPTTGSGTSGSGGAPGSGGGGDGGEGGTTGAGMADPTPKVVQGCSTGAAPAQGGGALAIVGLSLGAGLLRKRRRARSLRGLDRLPSEARRSPSADRGRG
jgi:hypothetical protein